MEDTPTPLRILHRPLLHNPIMLTHLEKSHNCNTKTLIDLSQIVRPARIQTQPALLFFFFLTFSILAI